MLGIRREGWASQDVSYITERKKAEGEMVCK